MSKLLPENFCLEPQSGSSGSVSSSVSAKLRGMRERFSRARVLYAISFQTEICGLKKVLNYGDNTCKIRQQYWEHKLIHSYFCANEQNCFLLPVGSDMSQVNI